MKKRILIILLIFVFALVGCDVDLTGVQTKNYCKDGEHQESEWKIITEATCTEDGIEGIVCEKCGKVLQSENIKATGHTVVKDEAVEATCEHEGLTEGSHCSVCNEVIVAQQVIKESHHYVITDSKDATKEEEGYITYQCELCKKSYTETIAKIGDYDETKPTQIYLSQDATTIGNNNNGVVINDNTITINKAGEYTLSGTLTNGCIIVSLGEDDKATLNLSNASITCGTTYPIYIESGDKVEISAKAETTNTIIDSRDYDEEGTGGAIYACCDLEIKGKGCLEIQASYNNGIATKDDLEVKNCTLNVKAPNNGLKGNDSITIESGTLTIISTKGDALKTESTDLSKNSIQRGIITILDGTINLYAACDGIDASSNCVISGGTINIYTEKNSTYSEEVSAKSESTLYVKIGSRISFSTQNKISAYFTLSDSTTKWVNASATSDGRNFYYTIDKPTNAKYVKFYVYSSTQTQGSDTTYTYVSDQLTIPTTNDCYSISTASNKKISGQWTNYSTQSYGPGGGGGSRPGGGGGGFNPGGDGNSDKADYSCKGIKADNEIVISGGTILIKAHDDAIHANSDVTLESTNKNGVGNVTISGGSITLDSDDDGIHADGTLTVSDGNIKINNSYEGLEGNTIEIKGGTIHIESSDDGINALSTLKISGGLTYMNANGDGIDSNGTITMTGGIMLALGPTNGGNGVIDFDRSFSFSGGLLLAIGCSGMNQKPTATTGNTSTSKSISTNTSSYVNVVVNSEIIATIKVVKSSQNYCVLAYNNSTYPSASTTITTTNSNELVDNCYYVK